MIILRATPSAAGHFCILGVAICDACCLHFCGPGDHFGTSGAPRETILALRDRPGGPWERQDGHEVVRNRSFIDLGVILGPVYMSFLNSGSLKFPLLPGLVSISLFHGFLSRHFDAGDSSIDVFAKKILQKSTFH